MVDADVEYVCPRCQLVLREETAMRSHTISCIKTPKEEAFQILLTRDAATGDYSIRDRNNVNSKDKMLPESQPLSTPNSSQMGNN